DFTFEDPHLYTDCTVGSFRTGCCVVDVSAQRMKRNATFTIPLGTSDFSAPKTARNLNLDALRAQAHRILHCALHCATEHYATLELGCNAIRYQLGIQLRLANLFNVDVDRHAHHLREIPTKLFDVFTFLPDHNTRTRCLDSDMGVFSRTLDFDATYRSSFQFLEQVIANF